MEIKFASARYKTDHSTNYLFSILIKQIIPPTIYFSFQIKMETKVMIKRTKEKLSLYAKFEIDDST